MLRRSRVSEAGRCRRKDTVGMQDTDAKWKLEIGRKARLEERSDWSECNCRVDSSDIRGEKEIVGVAARVCGGGSASRPGYLEAPEKQLILVREGSWTDELGPSRRNLFSRRQTDAQKKDSKLREKNER